MQLATIKTDDGERPVVVDEARGVALVGDLLPAAPADLLGVLTDVPLDALRSVCRSAPEDVFRPLDGMRFTVPYRHPRKIWGIGLNYVEHAGDLSESVPEEPASFLKADHTIIGDGDPIPLPRQSQRVTAEAELGLVIGRECRDVGPREALDYVWGVCTVLDQTAEDILERNPRFLTRAKNFPGFFSFGPRLVPLDEVLDAHGSLSAVRVATVLNGQVHRENTVSNMRYDPAFLVSFHSEVMPLFPGDIISTGTPGAAVIRAGDVAQCRIPGVGVLTNPVTGG